MKVKRTQSFSDIIELVDEHGNTVKEIPFTIDIKSINTKQALIRQQMAQTKGDTEEEYERLGNLFVDLMILLFGDAATNEIREFFGDRYEDMMLALTPVILDNVFPMFDRYNTEIKNMMKKRRKNHK